MGTSREIAGKIFGRLTAECKAGFKEVQHTPKNGRNPHKTRHTLWDCSCSCGGTATVRADRLLRGVTLSCGCYTREVRTAYAAHPDGYAAGRKRFDNLVRWSRAIRAGLRAEQIASGQAHVRDNRGGHRADYLHDLPPGTYESLLAEQSGVCAICATPPQAGKRLHVDHDHATEEVRGLLCMGCNLGLGSFGDDIMRMASAMKYLTVKRLTLKRGKHAVNRLTSTASP